LKSRKEIGAICVVCVQKALLGQPFTCVLCASVVNFLMRLSCILLDNLAEYKN